MSPIANSASKSAIKTLEELVALPIGQISIEDRIRLCRECVERVVQMAPEWVRLESEAKGLVEGERWEAVLSGPAVVLRQLQLSIQTLSGVAETGRPVLPGTVRRTATGQLAVPVFPTAGFFDSVTFAGLTAEVHMHPDAAEHQIHGDLLEHLSRSHVDGISLVLGAGNVSSIPATDTLNRVIFEGRRVLLKLNPVNDYLEHVFRDVMGPLIKAGLLRIVTGGGDVGASLVRDDRVTEIHVTGSVVTHEAIVWGTQPGGSRPDRPITDKCVTSELGNVTPWIVVPGDYTAKQLASQAQHLAASITNNVSFNCIATKMIVTSRRWSQRDEFLNLLRKALDETPTRKPYYPGATDRYVRFAAVEDPLDANGHLPWKLLVDQKPSERPELFNEESFVCVCAETTLDESDSKKFLEAAVAFVNDQLYGTLSASITLSNGLQRSERAWLERIIGSMRYGSVCLNQWSGLAYGLISTPWGAWPGSTYEDVQSGIGSVHNTYLLANHEKSVLRGPLVNSPKPIWFPSHRKADSVGWKLLELYHRPGLLRLPGLGVAAWTG
ncbi:MAG: aldehyde dehydrogenase family protein [Fuerstiella sp.]|nr:aldehyde dehydrogenase family protein [Fuerstiella sp.]